MHRHEEPVRLEGRGQPRLTVGAIARLHGESFTRQHALTEAQRKVLRAVSACRTPVLGGRVDVCAYSGDGEHLFRLKPNTQSGRCRTPAPT